MGSEAPEVLADDRNTRIVPPSRDAAQRPQFVLELTIVGLTADAARKSVAIATQQATAGTCVRLRVGRQIPMWLLAELRGDLVWQFVAGDVDTLNRWRDYIEGAA